MGTLGLRAAPATVLTDLLDLSLACFGSNEAPLACLWTDVAFFRCGQSLDVDPVLASFVCSPAIGFNWDEKKRYGCDAAGLCAHAYLVGRYVAEARLDGGGPSRPWQYDEVAPHFYAGRAVHEKECERPCVAIAAACDLGVCAPVIRLIVGWLV